MDTVTKIYDDNKEDLERIAECCGFTIDDKRINIKQMRKNRFCIIKDGKQFGQSFNEKNASLVISSSCTAIISFLK